VKIKICQTDFLVGEVQGNTAKILQIIQDDSKRDVSDIILFPELSIVGYPPEDLLFKHDLYHRVQQSLTSIKKLTLSLPQTVIVGHPVSENSHRFNALSVIKNGAVILQYRKQKLPNFSVFDEARYFLPGNKNGLFELNGSKVALLICEDIWHTDIVKSLASEKPDILLISNASPFHLGQMQKRIHILKEQQTLLACPIIYLNVVGGQDELVFDGGSLVINNQGEIMDRLPQFISATKQIIFEDKELIAHTSETHSKFTNNPIAELYDALVLGVKDYVHKNGFKGAVLGLSGGIDSALTLKIAVDALGAENVTAVMMPFTYTSSMSLEDAQQQAHRLQVKYEVISIESIYTAFEQQLAPYFKDLPRDKSEENLQSRCRGVLLMALSNKMGSIVLTTGNKSEMAVGYATLYGDMAGGFAVLKDVFKLDVYRLAKYCNRESEWIPNRVIQRPPSAELAPDQKDEDSLPSYDILDAILEFYIEKEYSFNDIVAKGYEPEMVAKIINLVDINEHKRRQSPPGVRVTQRAFGRDHRYPITSAYRRQTNPV